MTDYSELVKALRWCADESICGKKCPHYSVRGDDCNMDAVLHDAAAAIEELQARLCEAENSVENYKRMWLEKHELKTARWEGWTSTHWSKRCDSNGDPIYTEHTYYQCSYCGRRTVVRENFCPNCGAVMGVQE